MEKEQSKTPYSVKQVSKLLKMDENSIQQYCKELPIRPKRDLRSGAAMFSRKDVDILKKARELHASGESLTSIAKKLAKPTALTERVASKSDVAIILDTVSQAKDSILDDITKLLDEKLEGMDEVVVELIKCKSENETLKQKNKLLSEESFLLKNELNKFKCIKFGLYYRSDG